MSGGLAARHNGFPSGSQLKIRSAIVVSALLIVMVAASLSTCSKPTPPTDELLYLWIGVAV
jgi:hypothetical protein